MTKKKDITNKSIKKRIMDPLNHKNSTKENQKLLQNDNFIAEYIHLFDVHEKNEFQTTLKEKKKKIFPPPNINKTLLIKSQSTPHTTPSWT